MIIVISNREVNVGAANDARLFGEGSNAKGLDEVRLATATKDETEKTKDQWTLELLPEPDTLTPETLPSRQLFEKIVQKTKDGELTSEWVFYIHGYNQSFRKTLEASWDLEQTYGVNVIVFSWVANPGGFVLSEYKKARQAAKASSNAVDHSLEQLGTYLTGFIEELEDLDVGISLLVHSLGNFLVEQFVRSPVFSGETRIFENVIFHQPDVDHANHTEWIDRVVYGRRIYVTLNANDGVLGFSDIINPDRLGNTVRELNSKRVTYVDFTGGDNVRRRHNFFTGKQKNPVIKEFFKLVLTGQQGELIDGFQRVSTPNRYTLT
ncbi:MAG: alpha/beta hydrolase [Cyanobacteria bacterium P01_A01_bin.37]